MAKKSGVIIAAMALTITALTSMASRAENSNTVDMSADITISPGSGCSLSVEPVSTKVALDYTLTKVNLTDNTAGTYSNSSGDGVAKYVISAGTEEGCELVGFDITLPVMGDGHNAFGTWMSIGDNKFLTTAVLADLYSTPETNGTGTRSAVGGATYSLTSSSSGAPSITRHTSAWVNALTKTIGPDDANYLGINGSADFVVGGNVFVSTGSNTRSSGLGWPGGTYQFLGYKAGLIVSFLNGAQNGAHVVVPAPTLIGKKSVVFTLTPALSLVSYIGNVADVRNLNDRDVFSTNGTITITPM